MKSKVKLICDNCLVAMAKLPKDKIDTIITDPPYGLEFMGKEWDKLGALALDDPSVVGGFQDGSGGNPFSRICFNKSAVTMQQGYYDWACETFRVSKPGAFLFVFGGTKTWHRLASALEDAGWEIRDTVMWLHGQGFPKSLNISKAIDKAAGAKREVVGTKRLAGNACVPIKNKGGTYGVGVGVAPAQDIPITISATKLAQLWEGWGTFLKPCFEPIIVAMKPLDGTFAGNAEKYGVAGLWIDGGRTSLAPDEYVGSQNDGDLSAGCDMSKGRWPPNVVIDEEVGAMLDTTTYEGSSNVSRFFYCAKANKLEREMGLINSLPCIVCGGLDTLRHLNSFGQLEACRRNNHPTVKPLALMRYLVRLTNTPTGGIVLDPFMGSGTTGIACIIEGRHFVGIDQEPQYVEIAQKRIEAARGLAIERGKI